MGPSTISHLAHEGDADLDGVIEAVSVTAHGRRVVVEGHPGGDPRSHSVHPIWLRERSITDGQLEPASLQRLYDPSNIDPDLRVTAAWIDGREVAFSFSDDHSMRIARRRLAVELGWARSPEAPAAAEPWDLAVPEVPRASWADIVRGDDAALIAALDAFWRLGHVVLHDVPTEPGTVQRVAEHLGNLVPTNHGVIFNVVSVPDPVDLAYTPIHLNAHCDGPYRKPGVTIQLLHCLRNEAPGGHSTLVDGLAAANALAATDPAAYLAATTVPVDFRYDNVDDVVVASSPMIELRNGQFHRMRFSHRMDFVDAVDPDLLDAFYRARRWLRDHLNDPAHQTEFRLEAGHLMLMDNLRILHGRTAFDAGKGHRHLQGCYIDHDGLDTHWRMAQRRRSHGADGVAELTGAGAVTLPGGLD